MLGILQIKIARPVILLSLKSGRMKLTYGIGWRVAKIGNQVFFLFIGYCIVINM
ncbi:UNVERIFIED_CONTAM: hypothetical protein ABIC26_004173 [Paenibacillus sp. PvR008]